MSAANPTVISRESTGYVDFEAKHRAVQRAFIRAGLNDCPAGAEDSAMSNRTRVADQVRHYRELAQIAADCARINSAHAPEYLDLSRQWLSLADRIERDAVEANK